MIVFAYKEYYKKPVEFSWCALVLMYNVFNVTEDKQRKHV